MYNRTTFIILIGLLCIFKSSAQDCGLTIRGSVLDKASESPLGFVNVYIQELSRGTATDDRGNFILQNICSDEYHLTFSHIGCETKKIHLDLFGDTTLQILLSHTATSIENIVIGGKSEDHIFQPNLSVNRQIIEDNTNQNLSGILENEVGVHLLKNGSGISKPIIHGLYGNRLPILNNGILQSGQQWGNDHSPEIDPFTADRILVLKGANSMEYGGGSLGSAILVESKRIEKEPHLHGQINYIYETNGRGHSLNSRLEKFSPKLAWRMNTTIKKYGDKKTADYFLNNTGIKEFNISLQLEKSWNNKLFLDVYGSTFNTQLGILRGSHIGNITDLEQALSNQIPLFTESDFSYKIEAPKQSVSHHLLKSSVKYLITESQSLEIVLAGQVNNRKEFDVRRGGRSDIPSLSLSQYTLHSEVKYAKYFTNKWTLKLGNQNILTDNTNIPETDILPLIPDYSSWKSGLYTTLSKSKNNLDYQLGLRYDYENQNVATISNGIPREIIRYQNNFHNVSGLLNIKFNISEVQSLSFNTGYSMRNPAINELYSNGLHQGVSGIEEGDVSLNIEKSQKSTLEYEWLPNSKFSISSLFYYQKFSDYIFLKPSDEIRLTIRGAFPVFQYEQTDANIYGFDISSQFTIGNVLNGIIKYAYIKGEDSRNDTPLIFIPSNSLYASLTYRAKRNIKVSKFVLLEELELQISNRLVLKQNNILPEQDFIPPPPTYNLLGMKFSTNIIYKKKKVRFFINVDNLLNTQYRDYLNRQRYFADDIGMSISSGVNFKF